MGKIFLTDSDEELIKRARKHIDANLPGIETETLVEIHKQLFHTMMCSHEEVVGGYLIYYDYKAVKTELERRKAVPKGY